MSLKVAACIIDNIVVNCAVYDEDLSLGWLNSIKNNYDKVLIVDRAGVGWEEYEPNKLRSIQPSDEYSWDEINQVWFKEEPVE